jgi:hypothetical protein
MSFPSNTHHTSRPGDDIPVSASPADVLRDAATYLQRHGWIQGRYCADTHSLYPKTCVLGAINIAAHGEFLEDNLSDEYTHVVHLLEDTSTPRFPSGTTTHGAPATRS